MELVTVLVLSEATLAALLAWLVLACRRSQAVVLLLPPAGFAAVAFLRGLICFAGVLVGTMRDSSGAAGGVAAPRTSLPCPQPLS